MRTTVRIVDALLLELKTKAAAEDISLTRLLNRTLQAGLRAEQQEKRPKRRHREKTHSMGVPRVDLNKALSIASELEDDEALRKARLRK
jgi:hypothetical protein